MEHRWFECEAGHHPISVGAADDEPRPACPTCGGRMKPEPLWRKYPKDWSTR